MRTLTGLLLLLTSVLPATAETYMDYDAVRFSDELRAVMQVIPQPEPSASVSWHSHSPSEGRTDELDYDRQRVASELMAILQVDLLRPTAPPVQPIFDAPAEFQILADCIHADDDDACRVHCELQATLQL